MILTQHGINSIANSVAPIPEGSVILDYFGNGYRFGKPSKSDNFKNILYASSIELGLSVTSKTFGDRIPFARYQRDTSGCNKLTAYTLDDIVDDLNGFSVEYFIKTANSYRWVKDTAGMGNNEFKIMISYNDEAIQGHSAYSGWSWNPLPFKTSSTWHEAWHHFAYTIQRVPDSPTARLFMYIDGILVYDAKAWSYGSGYSIWTYDCMNDSNDRSNLGYYDLAQLAVWNYPKYTGNSFPVPKKLYIDN